MILVIPKLFRDAYYKKITINEAERKQDEFNAIIGVLEIILKGIINMLKKKVSS